MSKKYSEAGKGSGPRKSRNDDAYRDNYDKIFGSRKARHDRLELEETVRLSEALDLYEDDFEDDDK
jgi:hypothetical protein